MPDGDLDTNIARCLTNDQAGYDALYDQFAAAVYRLCYSLLLNREDAEDVTQESFVYAFRNLHRFNPQRASLKTWLFTIAICRCRNMYRRSRAPLTDFSQLLHLIGSKADAPEAMFAHQTAQDAVEQALRRLSPRLRESIVLRYGHGLTYREMAEIMGCPQKTAESRVRLAHEALRGLLHGEDLLEELASI
ncbi:MAG: sigma-70 family RNA polymerase sigma factor [Anaerolineae bacterium]|nr:sigma-70 family RNA polymerase sigma factor [Anaerolineae bacterium]